MQRQFPALPSPSLESLALWARQVTDMLQRGEIVTRAQGAGNTSVRLATTVDLNLANALESGDTLDGVTLAAGDLVLVKNQSIPAQNGIYKVPVSGAASRADAFSTYDAHVGAIIQVQEGTAGGSTVWQCTSTAGGTLGTTAIDWVAVGIPAAGSITNAQLANMAQQTIKARKTLSTGAPEDCTLSEVLDFIGSAAQGDLLYRDASAWARLAAGTSGQFLKTQGAGANPVWDSAGGMVLLASGTVTSAATLDISLTAHTGYRAIKFILSSFVPATDARQLLMRFSTDGGANFVSSGYRYAMAGQRDGNSSAVVASTSASQILLSAYDSTRDPSNVAGEGGIDTEITLHNQAAARWSRLRFHSAWTGADQNTVSVVGEGTLAAAQDTDAVRFFFASSSDIASGNYGVYGLL